MKIEHNIRTGGGGSTKAEWGKITGDITLQSDLMDLIPSTDGLASKDWVEGQGYLTEHQSLEGYATQTWVEEQGYLTEHQSLEGYATETYVDEKVDGIKGDFIKNGISENDKIIMFKTDPSGERSYGVSVNENGVFIDSGYGKKTYIEGDVQFGSKHLSDFLTKSQGDSYYIHKNNVKTINGESIIGSGNIEIKGGGADIPTPQTGVLAYLNETFEDETGLNMVWVEGHGEYNLADLANYAVRLPSPSGEEKIYLLWDYNVYRLDENNQVTFLSSTPQYFNTPVRQMVYEFEGDYFYCWGSNMSMKWIPEIENFELVQHQDIPLFGERVIGDGEKYFYIEGMFAYRLTRNPDYDEYMNPNYFLRSEPVQQNYDVYSKIYKVFNKWYLPYNEGYLTFNFLNEMFIWVDAAMTIFKTPNAPLKNIFNQNGNWYMIDNLHLYKQDEISYDFFIKEPTNWMGIGELLMGYDGKIHFFIEDISGRHFKYFKTTDSIEWSNAFATKAEVNTKQTMLQSGLNIAKINGVDILRSGSVQPYKEIDILNSGKAGQILMTKSNDKMNKIIQNASLEIEGFGMHSNVKKYWGDDEIGYHTYEWNTTFVYKKDLNKYVPINWEMDNGAGFPMNEGHILKFKGQWLAFDTWGYYILHKDGDRYYGEWHSTNDVMMNAWNGMGVIYDGSEEILIANFGQYFTYTTDLVNWNQNVYWGDENIDITRVINGTNIYLWEGQRYLLHPTAEEKKVYLGYTEGVMYGEMVKKNDSVVIAGSGTEPFYFTPEQLYTAGDIVGEQRPLEGADFQFNVGNMFRLDGKYYVFMSSNSYYFTDTTIEWVDLTSLLS